MLSLRDTESQPNDGGDGRSMVETTRSGCRRVFQSFAVPIVFGLFVVMRSADRVILKRVQNALQNSTYNLMLMNIIWPLAIQVMTVAMIVVYIVIKRREGNSQYTWRFFLPGSKLASAAGAVPLYQMGLFSLGDQLQAAIMSPSSAFISQTMQSVISNTSVIWTALLALAVLNTRFGQVHAIGCILIVCSVVVGVSNQIQNGDCSQAGVHAGKCLTSYSGNDGVFHKLSASSMMIWYGLFIAGTIPGSVSNIYKQYVLQGRDVDILYATWWSGNFQIVWGWLCIWLIWIPLPGQPGIQPGDTFNALADTWSCLCGRAPHPGDESCAEGSLPPIFWFIVFMLFNVAFNVILLWLTKRMSATWTQIATVLCLDLTNIFSQFRFIAGGAAQTMTLSDWLATVIATVSLWIYNLEPERQRKQAEPYFAPFNKAAFVEQASKGANVLTIPLVYAEEISIPP